MHGRLAVYGLAVTAHFMHDQGREFPPCLLFPVDGTLSQLLAVLQNDPCPGRRPVGVLIAAGVMSCLYQVTVMALPRFAPTLSYYWTETYRPPSSHDNPIVLSQQQ